MSYEWAPCARGMGGALTASPELQGVSLWTIANALVTRIIMGCDFQFYDFYFQHTTDMESVVCWPGRPTLAHPAYHKNLPSIPQNDGYILYMYIYIPVICGVIGSIPPVWYAGAYVVCQHTISGQHTTLSESMIQTTGVVDREFIGNPYIN